VIGSTIGLHGIGKKINPVAIHWS